MAIDYQLLDAANIEFPTQEIPVPELSDFFPAGEDPVWVVKPLTGHELAQVNEAAEHVERVKNVIRALSSGDKTAEKKGMAMYLGQDDESTPQDLARRHKMLALASVPPCPEHVAVRLAHAKPTTFYKITNKIIAMTGQGADLGK